jgi:hypothetical protein
MFMGTLSSTQLSWVCLVQAERRLQAAYNSAVGSLAAEGASASGFACWLTQGAVFVGCMPHNPLCCGLCVCAGQLSACILSGNTPGQCYYLQGK